jgi:AcrR family transcriptional regulator
MPDDKRQRILRTALQAFIRYGYRRATMGDVAKAVGVSRPALYLSFPSKEALCHDAVELALGELLQEIEAGLATRDSLEAKLSHVFEIWSVRTYELVTQSPDAHEMMNASYDFMADVFERANARLTRLLAGVIRAAVDEPDALQPSPEARARILIASAHGFKTAARGVPDLRALVHDLISVTVAGLPVAPRARADRRGRSKPRP